MFIYVAFLTVKDIDIVDNKLYNVGLTKILKYVDLCLMNVIFFCNIVSKEINYEADRD